YVVLPLNRDKFISYLTKNDIGCMPFYEALTNQPYWNSQSGAYCAEEIGNSAVAIPLYPTMQDGQVDKVIQTIRAYDW
ncbi:hypothetical protein EBZ39_14545, partial [bacterium]|nr:hypothetical protein [bacterium]